MRQVPAVPAAQVHRQRGLAVRPDRDQHEVAGPPHDPGAEEAGDRMAAVTRVQVSCGTLMDPVRTTRHVIMDPVRTTRHVIGARQTW